MFLYYVLSSLFPFSLSLLANIVQLAPMGYSQMNQVAITTNEALQQQLHQQQQRMMVGGATAAGWVIWIDYTPALCMYVHVSLLLYIWIWIFNFIVVC